MGDADKRAAAVKGNTVRPPVSEFPQGAVVGRYVLLQPLGRGGMGAVYAAYDTALDRRVALKFLHSAATGTSAEEWRERLQREARAMARLSHPNVVTLYDVGLSEDGRSFLAMELVEGGTLSEWLKAEKRRWRDVVRTLCEAGEGLAAAHAMGIIHRDFKLDNVLIGKDGRPRVTDFGIARGVDDPSGTAPRSAATSITGAVDAAALPQAFLTGMTGPLSKLTMTGGMLGTPGYMAPEQYLGEVEPDERVDIFAFSATLYHALYGQRAFKGETVAALAESTVIGVVQAPPPGSDVPAWVHRALLYGLASAREKRPPTMRALLAALSQDPAAVRRRWMWRAAGGVGLAAVAFAFVAEGRTRVDPCAGERDGLRIEAWAEERRAAVERAFLGTGKPYAADAFRAVARSLDGYADRWEGARREACLATRVRHEVSEAVHDRTMLCLGRRRDEVKALVDVMATADDKTVEKALSAAASIAPAAECAATAALDSAWVRGVPGDPRGQTVRAETARAGALLAAGRSSAAHDAAEAALRDAHEAGDAEAENDARHVLGRAQVGVGNYAQARAALLEAASASIAARDDRRSAQSLIFLADVVGEYQGQQAPALEWFRMAESVTQRFEPREATLATLLAYRALLRYRSSDYDGAVDDAQRALKLAEAPSNNDPVLAARVLNVLGNVYLDRAQYDASVDNYERSLAIYEAQLGPSHPSVAIEIGNLALTHHARGDYVKALEFHARALAIQEAALGPEHPSVALTLSNASAALYRLGRYDEALDHASRSLALFQRASGPDHPNVAMARTGVGDALLGLGRTKEALEQYSIAIDDATRAARSDSPLTASAVLGRAAALLALGKVEPAFVDAERVVKLRRSVLGAHHPDVAEALLVEARIRAREGRAAAAVALLTDARAIVDASASPPWLRAEVNDALARATWEATKDRERSRRYATDARDAYAAAGPGEAGPARSLDTLLASLASGEETGASGRGGSR